MAEEFRSEQRIVALSDGATDTCHIYLYPWRDQYTIRNARSISMLVLLVPLRSQFLVTSATPDNNDSGNGFLESRVLRASYIKWSTICRPCRRKLVPDGLLG